MSYRNGIRDASQPNFMLGLESLYHTTHSPSLDFGLNVTLEDWDGLKYWAAFCSFSIGPESDYYPLYVSGHHPDSTAGDSLSYHNGMAFSTYDADHDTANDTSCAQVYNAGWWYKACHTSHLTGIYYQGETLSSDGIVWWKVHNGYYTFKYAEMTLVVNTCACP